MSRAVRCVQPGFVLPKHLTDFVRARVEMQEYYAGVGQLEGTNDVWFSFEPISAHVDRKPGTKCMTSGLILINDARHELLAGGNTYYLPPGTVFQIDVSLMHSTSGDKPGMFAFLAWDSFPKDARPVREFAMEAVFSLTWKCLGLGMTA